MNVIWSDTAKLHWSKAIDFIAKEFGYSAAETFVRKTIDTVTQLSVMPQSGPLETLVADSIHSYRSIVYAKHSKLIYCVFEDTILINDYWDTRQEPTNLKNRL